MDVLSEVLKVVKLTGAVFYNAEFSFPWSFRSPPSKALGRYVSAEDSHVIIFHLLTEGCGWVQLEQGPRVQLRSGELVVFPHGDSHVMGNGPPVEPVDTGQDLERIMTHGLRIARSGGGGEVTRFICGYLACEPQLSRVLLAALPPLLKVNIRDGDAGEWIENSIRFSVAQASSSGPGIDAVLARLSEVLFVETLRRYISGLPAEETGWLAGARDAEVGTALALLHREPSRPWTLADLASKAGVSRSILAERFRHYLGEPPMSYLTRWRLQLGARMLTGGSQSMAQIAAQVGYESEAAFNRAFKREFSVPPAKFRKLSRAARATT